MRRTVAVCGLLWVGCGPQVTLSSGDSGDGSGDDGTTTSGTNDDGVTRPTPTTADDTGGDELDSGEDGATDGPPVDPGECWHTQDMFEAPEDVTILVTDQDNDGADELWLLYNVDNGPGPGQTTLYRVDDTGRPSAEIPLSGFLVGIGDIDGRGLRDLVTISFGGGNSGFRFSPATGPGEFEFPPLPMQLPLQPGYSGFFDIDGDGPADVFQLLDDGTLELQLGDGLGAFVTASAAAVGMFPAVAVQPIDGAPGLAVLQSFQGFGGPGGRPTECVPTEYRVLAGEGGMLQTLAASPPPAGPTGIGPLLRAHADPSGTVILYTTTCDPAATSQELRALRWQPDLMQLEPSVVLSDVQWVTPADVDGDGLLDLVFALPDADTMTWSPATEELAFDTPLDTQIGLPEIRNNNVRPVDLDGDGRDELLRGYVLTDGNPAQLFYERVWLGPC